jgi:hypothetical protein
MSTIKLILPAALALGLAGCDLEVPDLSNPGLEDLEDNPNRANVTAATTGLLIGSRGNYAAANGYVAQLGILGREAYNFDQADPRFVGELLGGQLNAGSPFGGNFWTGPYSNIRQVHIVLAVVDQVAELSEEERAGIRGFAKTVWALDLLEIITTRDENGVVIDTDRPVGDVGAIVEKDEAVAFVADLLDEAAGDLEGAGDAFAFPLSSGFAGFDEPVGFRTFNRALRARVAAYQEDYATVLAALGESFLTEPTSVADLNIGAYYSYSNSQGDIPNNLINPNIYAHPSVETLAEEGDLRLARKVTTTDDPGAVEGRTSELVFTIYNGPTAPVPIIRNEELILLRAEANALQATPDFDAAAEDINLTRTISGGLDPIVVADIDSRDTFLDELLYNRLYSLLFEGGHRWIDVRRFDRVEDLPLDLETDLRNIRFPIPLSECNARPGEAACSRGST